MKDAGLFWKNVIHNGEQNSKIFHLGVAFTLRQCQAEINIVPQ